MNETYAVKGEFCVVVNAKTSIQSANIAQVILDDLIYKALMHPCCVHSEYKMISSQVLKVNIKEAHTDRMRDGWYLCAKNQTRYQIYTTHGKVPSDSFRSVRVFPVSGAQYEMITTEFNNQKLILKPC